MRLVSVIGILLAATLHVFGLHFYLDSDEERCFIEELPSGTIVEGHYKALEWKADENKYILNPEIGLNIEVDEVATGDSVVKTLGPPEGKFTFTSHEAGDHTICLSTNQTSGWFSSSHIRLYLDIAVGAARHDVEKDRAHANKLSDKLRELNDKLDGIRREQQYQREREAQFRNLSESVNAKAMWYMLIQACVLVVTCYWQLRFLRYFFADRKGL
ncbi:SubName: Full=Related to p24 protein, involved in membrane trafficking {ECO:0000313/EMBL:CCA68219.1} [Serendipita indica DSM 11827]|uniref:Related to p24 protein, involved in membrane trafficking n=1 Tax=Serendipita indica (strain DSM 11827) TaxID=1109443 RepID=G4TA81_SERID|nr:SubName: Full=Related to p24 protein, involved in membrane trafficking {ECO:0000313/EMBL:CCA68219.1} [Serendipita indica DSM 11827]CCA68219.1 related to p24 protein, involved in membrane trafficking [Serendipita indica DSM 11827]